LFFVVFCCFLFVFFYCAAVYGSLRSPTNYKIKLLLFYCAVMYGSLRLPTNYKIKIITFFCAIMYGSLRSPQNTPTNQKIPKSKTPGGGYGGTWVPPRVPPRKS
jgi:hypothetical protein